MATAAQVAANQQNATRSTGPRTEDGKARSAQNGRTHGLAALRFFVRPEDKDHFQEFVTTLLDQFKPQGCLEAIFFQHVLHAQWNMHRSSTIEATLSLTNPENAQTLATVDRYFRRNERSFYRALAELRKLQAERAAAAPSKPLPMPKVEIRVAQPAAAEADRTQSAAPATPETPAASLAKSPGTASPVE